MPSLFVVGARRTGTTLLTAVLCADANANPLLPEAQLITRFLEDFRWAKRTFDLFGNSFENILDLTNFFRDIINEYANRTLRRFNDPEYLVLKNPEYSLFIDDLIELAPGAKFIVSIRDPRDQVVSEIEVAERQSANKSATSQSIKSITGYAEMFNSYYRPILSASLNKPELFLFVRYEDLVLNFQGTLKILNDFTGMGANQFDPNGDWARLAVDPATFSILPSWSPYYGRALQASRIGRYQAALSPDEVRRIEECCSSLMDRFGYAVRRN